MKTVKKLGLLSSAVVILGIAVTGCGNSNSANSNVSGKSSNQATSNSSAGKAQPILMLPTPEGSYQKNFNPFSTTADYGAIGLVYEPLFYYDGLTGKKFPFLGKTMTWSNGNKTLTVQLNTKAKWSDGKPFTAQDVVYTFQILKKNPSLDLNGVWQKLNSVKAKGTSAVVFNFKQADVPFAMYVLETYIVPKHIWKNISNPAKNLNASPVGTGPYTLQSFTSQDIKYKANPNYYKGKPPVPEVEIPAYNGNNSATLALTQGKLDWTGLFIPNIKKIYTSKKSTNNYWFPPTQIFSLLPNFQNPLLSKKVVRQAMSLAINRKALAQKAEYGFEQVAQPNAVSPSQSKWLDPNLTASEKSFTYSVSKAKQLLQNAGYKENGSGVMVSPSGKQLKFNLITVAGWTDWDMQASMIAQDLKQIGIKVNVQQEQNASYQANLKAHKFQLAVSAANGGPNPYYVFDALLRTKGASNWMAYSNKTVDKALNTFAGTTDPTKQKQSIYTIEKVMANDLPTIPLTYNATWYEFSTAKYTGWPSKNNPYVSPSVWNRPAASIILMHLKPAK
ncbi:ABC transporter substrate-binding protein [Alicyclobacillus sp. SO9]|uniref:ABC transporter substrate-binding protein n=1 Tax=Alicyclobacillus sp. SO9 TaxID=2665646 RepID=UPI0018E8836D|nr:ABC transporter substrate-binding protein [Alicyclobacillus sp. SO9]QQE77892.1 ABC transporter substrate-binding protein [Alicyclobacillus sp. SO9]